MTGEGTRIGLEVTLVVAVVLLAIRLVVAFGSGVAWDLPLVLVPILFMWAPVWVLQRRGVDPDRYPLAIPAFSDRAAWWEALRVCGWAVILIGPPYLVVYHLWHTEIFAWVLQGLCDQGFRGTCRLARSVADVAPSWVFPSRPLMLVGYHLFFVAIPEELFYRGYVQSRLDAIWAPRWKVAGALVGPGWLVTCVVFAFGHSVVAFQWWHFAIFFPALLFGWMRARTGGIMAGALFHAWSNITVGVLDVMYGLQPP